MARVVGFELRAVDLPFRISFKHAAAARTSSSSVFLKAVTDSGACGFGECLPRQYVTGETQESTFDLLHNTLLPKLAGVEFASWEDVIGFLAACDGQSPPDWQVTTDPHTAAWCAIDLALLDAFGRHFGSSVRLPGNDASNHETPYSVVISSDVKLKTLLKIRLAGIRQVKLKLERHGNQAAARRCRRVLGTRCDIRADANMAWGLEQAVREMQALDKFGIRSFEQPLAADRLDQLAELVARMPGFNVMVDESLNNRESLTTLIDRKACTAVNVRISKCGGLVASLQRCRQALDHGLRLQIGCQVGESSLLSAAHLILRRSVPAVEYLEGCFGKLLLLDDPAHPVLRFGYRGKPPTLPPGPGLGVAVDEETLTRYTVRCETLSLQ